MRQTPALSKSWKGSDATVATVVVASPVTSPRSLSRRQRWRDLEKELAGRGDVEWLKLLEFDPMEDFLKASKAIEQRRRVSTRARSMRQFGSSASISPMENAAEAGLDLADDVGTDATDGSPSSSRKRILSRRHRRTFNYFELIEPEDAGRRSTKTCANDQLTALRALAVEPVS